MQDHPVADGIQPQQPVFRILQRHAPHGAMNLIALRQKKLRKIRSILPGDPGNQRASRHKNHSL